MRKANKEDIASIVYLCTDLGNTVNYSEHTVDVEYISNSISRCFDSEDIDILVYERSGVIIGAACGMEHTTLLCPDKEYSELFVICYDPRGVLWLISNLEKRAKEREVVRMTIGSSTADNTRYCQLLELKGFTSFGRSFRKVL